MAPHSWARVCFTSFCGLLLAATAGAQHPSATDAYAASQAPARPRVGLALSGGGARGFAHVGVLRALEALRIPVDCIAATSAGSAVGAAYAMGRTPDEIEAALRSADWDRDMFDDAPPRREQQARRKAEEKAYLLDLTVGLRDGSLRAPPGLVSGQKVELFLHGLLGQSTELGSFDQLSIPFRAVATDLERGEMVVQTQGSLVTAVRASMAVPSAFAPVEVDGRLLVDGGLTRNLPVDVVRGVCADVVIAVDISGPLLDRESLGTALGVAGQMVNILMDRNMRDSRAELRPGIDILVRPDLGTLGSAAFSRGVEGIPAGEAAMRAAAPLLTALVVDEGQYARWQQQRFASRMPDDRYQRIQVTGTDPQTARALLAQAQLDPDTPGRLDRNRLAQAIQAWNSAGDFDRIGYTLRQTTAGQVLDIEVFERDWGPNYLRFGLGAAADSKANSLFNVLVGYRRPHVLDGSAEFKATVQFGTTRRATAEWYQPFSRGDARLFALPYLNLEERPIWLFSGQNRVAEYGVQARDLGIDFGVDGRIGEFRLGVFAGSRDTLLRTGPPLLPEPTDQYWGARATLLIDQLDATDFPRDGYWLGASYRAEVVENGAAGTPVRNRLEVAGKAVESWGPHTVSASFRVGEARVQGALSQLFSLGGFMNLSGLQINQLLGSSLRYASLGYQNQILTLPNPLGRGVYAGAMAEVADLRGTLSGIQTPGWMPGATLYLGAHTAIGPIYLGYGVAQDNNRLFYLFLGRPGL